MLDLQAEAKFCFPKIFHSKYFDVLMSSLRIPIRFRSSTYTTIIANPVFDFLKKMHGHIGLFSYPSFNKHSLMRLYHMHPDCFIHIVVI